MRSTCAAIAGCRRDDSSETHGGIGPRLRTIVHPARRAITRTIQQPGYLKAYEQTPIYSKIAGYVQDVKVDIDDHVHKGDLLLKLWVPELEQDLKAKDARVTQAGEVTQAEQAFKAAEALEKTQEALVIDTQQGIEQAKAENELRKRCDRAMRMFKANVYDKQTLDESKNQKDPVQGGNRAKTSQTQLCPRGPDRE